jgi:hypothetical protein
MGRNLHGTSYIFQPKRGLAADLNSLASRNSAVPGELAFTTDTGQLWAFNPNTGYYEEVNKYTSYIYNSSGAQGGNRFNDWAAMLDSIDGREVRVQFEQDETIPAGAWNIDYHTWIGNGQNPDSGGLIITFETGTTISSALNWQCQNGLNLYSTSDNPIYVETVPHVMLFDRTAIFTDNIEFIKVTCAGLIAVQVSNGFGLYNDGASAGNYEVFNIASSDYATVLVITENGIAPTVQNNTVRSEVPFVYGWLKQTSEALSEFATHANLDPGSINFGGTPLGPGGAYFANAAVIGFLQGQPAGIPSDIDNVSDALGYLATHAVDVPSSASDTGTAGEIAYDSSYIYVCIATDTWARTPIASW